MWAGKRRLSLCFIEFQRRNDRLRMWVWGSANEIKHPFVVPEEFHKRVVGCSYFLSITALDKRSICCGGNSFMNNRRIDFTQNWRLSSLSIHSYNVFELFAACVDNYLRYLLWKYGSTTCIFGHPISDGLEQSNLLSKGFATFVDWYKRDPPPSHQTKTCMPPIN